MNSSIDLSLLLFARQGAEDVSELPDLYLATPTHRPARERESDSLIIYLSMTGNSPLPPGAHTQLLEQLSQKFYKTTGSLTAAMRSIAEAINLQLLDRNLRSTSSGKQGIGQLLLVALRADTLYIAECGAVQAYLVTPTHTQALYDLETTGRGLGLSRSTPVRFLQIKITPDDYLILSTIASPDWSDTLLHYPTANAVEELRHQLTANASLEFNAVIVQARPGKGKLQLLRSKPAGESLPDKRIPAASPPVPDQVGVPESLPVAGIPETPLSEALPPAIIASPSLTEIPTQEAKDPAISVNQSLPAAVLAAGATLPQKEKSQTLPQPSQTGSPPVPEEGKSHPAVPPVKTDEAVNSAAAPVKPIAQPQKIKFSLPQPVSRSLTRVRAALISIVAVIFHAIQKGFSVIGIAMLRLLKNLLPDADVLRLPQSTMIFITIAVPLILAVVGGMVFLQRGQTKQHELYYQQAVEKADYAATLTNPLEQRFALQTALGELDKAEEYAVTSQSQALRSDVTSSLDALDSVRRLDYQPAIVNGLDSSIKVIRIIAIAADLYLLNGNDGSVLHAVLTSRGYEMDPTFQCGPTSGPITVGPLVDIAELPPGGYENASLLGLDSNGNLLYCVIGSQPYSASLAPPNTGLGQTVGMSLDRNDLYVLDPSVNAVWIYRNLEVSQPPRLFFGDTVPPMQDVIDLEVYNDDLYMLHADGHTTRCIYSAMPESPTRCDDPYAYSDNRPGRVHGPVVEDAVFTQMDYISFPERSIFYLDPQHQSIYYFSVLLTLQYQYQPKTKLAEGDATAFSVSANRIAFLAIANNVYYAAMP